MHPINLSGSLSRCTVFDVSGVQGQRERKSAILKSARSSDGRKKQKRRGRPPCCPKNHILHKQISTATQTQPIPIDLPTREEGRHPKSSERRPRGQWELITCKMDGVWWFDVECRKGKPKQRTWNLFYGSFPFGFPLRPNHSPTCL